MPELATLKKSAAWAIVAFGDVVQLSKKRSNDPEADGYERYIGLEHIDSGELRIRRWGDIADGVSFTNLFHPGQVLFGKWRAYLRKVAVADFSGVCSSDIYVLEPKDDALLPELLPFICQTDAFFDHAVDTSAGSLSPRTNWKSLADFKFALPPIEEQKSIIVALNAIETAHQSLAVLVREIKKLELSSANAALKPPKGEKGTPLSVFSTEDIEKIDVVDGDVYRAAGVLNEGQGLFKKEPIKGSETKYRQFVVLRKNQIVMRKLTAWEGSIAVVPSLFDGAVVSTEFPTMSLDLEQVTPRYLAWVFRQPWFWREMKSRCAGTALRRARLHQRELLKIAIQLPSLDKQVAVAEQLDFIREQYDGAVARLELLAVIKGRFLRSILRSGQHGGA